MKKHRNQVSLNGSLFPCLKIYKVWHSIDHLSLCVDLLIRVMIIISKPIISVTGWKFWSMEYLKIDKILGRS